MMKTKKEREGKEGRGVKASRKQRWGSSRREFSAEATAAPPTTDQSPDCRKLVQHQLLRISLSLLLFARSNVRYAAI